MLQADHGRYQSEIGVGAHITFCDIVNITHPYFTLPVHLLFADITLEWSTHAHLKMLDLD